MNKFALGILFIVSFFFLNCSKGKVEQQVLSDGDKVKDNGNIPGQNTSGGNISNITNSAKSVKDDITVKTEDSKDISASYIYNEGSKETPQPLVILIHQFKQSKEQWKQDFIDSLLVNGYKVLAFDIRGHGKSSKQDGELTALLSDPEQAPKDIAAIVKWAKSEKGVDSSRIAAIGTSIGGNLALYGGLNLGIKTSIAISNGKTTFEQFTGYNEMMMGRPYFPKIKNVLFVCGTKDGDHEAGQKWIMENFVEGGRELKTYDTGKHGKELIEEYPEVNGIILNWLKKYL